MKNVLTLFAALFLSSQVFAVQTQSMEKKSIDEIVDDYYAMKSLNLAGQKHDCYPQGASCFKTACENVGTFECDDQAEMNTLRKACRGVWGDACLKYAFTKLRKFEYDDNDEMALLANSCRGLYDFECVRYTCDRMGPFDCDDLEEIRQINMTCSGMVNP